MTEPTEQANARADASDPLGQRIDVLLSETKKLDELIVRHERDLEDAKTKMRARVSALADMLGRPGAAKLLGITPRELAGILRGVSR